MFGRLWGERIRCLGIMTVIVMNYEVYSFGKSIFRFFFYIFLKQMKQGINDSEIII